MLMMKASVCIEATVNQSWAVLSDLENIVYWAEPVLSTRCTGATKHGMGAERVCKLKGNIEIVEKWTAWEEGKSFIYQGYGLPLIRSAKNRWSIEAVDDRTLLTSESTIELKGGWLGQLLEPLMKIMSLRMAADSLAAFKYLVENGQPFTGKFSSLPRVSAI